MQKLINGDFRVRTTFGEGWIFGEGEGTYFVAFSRKGFNPDDNITIVSESMPGGLV